MILSSSREILGSLPSTGSPNRRSLEGNFGHRSRLIEAPIVPLSPKAVCRATPEQHPKYAPATDKDCSANCLPEGISWKTIRLGQAAERKKGFPAVRRERKLECAMATERSGANKAFRVPVRENSSGNVRPQGTEARCGLRVLGVDPAAAGATGYGVIEGEGTKWVLLRFGAFKLPAAATFASRLREIHRTIADLVAEFSPDAVAVESVFTALNARTALKLAEIRGVVLLAAAQAAVPAFSYSPREVKASVAGYGAASKQQMQQMVSSLLRLSSIPEPTDAADALAVALCHAQLSQARERMAAAMAGSPAGAVRGRSNNARAGRVSSQT